MAETDPPRGKPAIVWWMLGAIVMAAFAGLVILHRPVAPKHAVGPPAGAPAAH